MRQKETMEPLTIERIRDLWSQTYNREGKPDWSHLFPYYHEDIVFEDSIQRVEGIAELNMNILSIVMDSRDVFLQWEMVMMFRRFPSTPIYGCTKLTLGDDNRIIHQRDYFDLWGDIFNGIPWFRRMYRRFLHRYFG
jgi:hypothetical protein